MSDSTPAPGIAKGRMVRYIAPDGNEYVAVVSDALTRDTGLVHLHVFVFDEEHPVKIARNVPYSEAPKLHSWHWPPRV